MAKPGQPVKAAVSTQPKSHVAIYAGVGIAVAASVGARLRWVAGRAPVRSPQTKSKTIAFAECRCAYLPYEWLHWRWRM